MIDPPNNTRQLKQLARRPGVGPLRFLVEDQQADLKDNVSLLPDDLYHEVGRVAKLTEPLPMGVYTSQRKAQLRRAQQTQPGNSLRLYGIALSHCAQISVDPKAFKDVEQRLARLEVVATRAERWVNAALDLRLVLGALQSFVLSRVLQDVVGRLESPTCTPAERERLESKFGKLLLHKDALIADQQKQRELLAERRREMEAQAAEADRQTLLTNVLADIRLGRPVDQATLEAAARYMDQQQQSEAAQRAAAAQAEAAQRAEAAGKNARKARR